MTKWIIGIGIVVIVGIGLWWSGMLSSFMPPSPQTPPKQTTPAPQGSTNDLPTGSNDASDTAINQDAAAIDAQLKSLGSDSASLNSSIDDKPLTQDF